MRKILMIFAAMAAVLSSCSKSGLESATANESKDIVLNISVSAPGDDTKALIKTGWKANDQIKIWFDTRTGGNPDLVIKYNKTNDKWTQDGTAAYVPTSGTGKVKAVYSNNVIVASVDGYTLSGNTLTFSIANWVFLTEVQVVVKNLTSAKASSYTLSCDKFTPLASTGNGYTVSAGGITASKGTKGAAVTGISNADGVAFVFATADYSATAAAFKFTLKDNTSGSVVTKEYKPNVAIAAKDGKQTIKALTIASSKFQKAVPEGFVDLGLPSGILWATKNLGASKPEEYGTYFSWGDVNGQKPSFTKSFDWSNDVFGQNFSKVQKSVACPNGVLATTYDAAYKSDGSWRTPTLEEFKELCDNTNYTWTTISSVNGWKFTSKKDSNKYVFFPAAGYVDGTSLTAAGSNGYYWSSSLRTSYSNDAFGLNFSSGDVYPQSSSSRYFGLSVRPVSEY